MIVPDLHSYSETSSPSPSLWFWVLRNEARVKSESSLPDSLVVFFSCCLVPNRKKTRRGFLNGVTVPSSWPCARTPPSSSTRSHWQTTPSWRGSTVSWSQSEHYSLPSEGVGRAREMISMWLSLGLNFLWWPRWILAGTSGRKRSVKFISTSCTLVVTTHTVSWVGAFLHTLWQRIFRLFHRVQYSFIHNMALTVVISEQLLVLNYFLCATKAFLKKKKELCMLWSIVSNIFSHIPRMKHENYRMHK